MSSRRDRLTTVFRRVFDRVPPPGEDLDSREMEGWDSVAHINLILIVEQEFGITFTPQEAAIATSFQSMLDLIASKSESA